MAEEEEVLLKTSDGNYELDSSIQDLQVAEKSEKLLPFWKLYRYVKCLDVLLIILAVVFGLIAGVCYPIQIYLFVITFNEFIDYALIDAIKRANYTQANYSYFCDISKQSDLQEYYVSDDPERYLQDQATTHSYYIIGLSLVFFLSTAMSRFLWTISAARQARSMRLNYLKSLLTRHVGWFDINPSTELPTHLSQGIQSIETAIGRSMVTIIENFVTFLFCFAIAFYVNWKLATVTGSLLPPMFLFAFIIGKTISIFNAKKQVALGKAGSVAKEVIASIKTVKAFGGQDKENERYHSNLKQAKRKSFIVLFLVGTLLGIISMIQGLMFIATYWYGFGLFVDCEITAGEIFLILIEIGLGTMILVELVPELTDVFVAIGSATVVFGVIDQTSEIDPDSDAGIIPDTVDGNIELSDIRFSYPSRPDVEVLHGLDLTVKSGQTVALVGSSGSGKSTIVSLVSRIHDITAGSVSLDGIDVRDLNIKWLRNQIGVVSQEPVLFNVSIAENISYGKEDATVEEIEMAAKSANAHNFICDLPDGYNTLAGDGGSQLSGGQKQRIAIARALVNDPKILLLDEATSALDTESEKIVQDALDKAKESRTTIVIAHRLSTIQTSDVIVAIDKGNVVEFGSHGELMKKEGLYYQLVMNQKIEETEEEDEDFPQTLKSRLDEHARKSLLSSTDEPSKVIEQESDTEDETEDSPFILKKTVSATDTTTPDKEMRAIPLIYLIVLCFKKIHWFLLVLTLILSSFSGASFAITYYLFHGIIEYATKTDKDDVLYGAHIYGLLFGALGMLQLILTFFSINTLGFCEEHVVETVRQKLFQTILKRHMSWFDRTENSVSALSHRLSVEASNIDQAFDVKVGHAYRSIITVLVSIIIGFIMSWVVALVILPAFVLMPLGGFIQLVLTKRYTDQRNALIEDSAKVAIEAIENVYTVATLGIETRLVRKYDDLLKLPFKIDLKSIMVNGIVYSFSQAILPFTVGFSYIAGAYIYTSDKDEIYYADYADIFTAILTIWFTSRTIKRFFGILPDSQNAASSARSFLNLLSQPAAVENLEDGIIPDEVNGDIKIQQLHFVYPARPEVTVLKNVDVSVSAGHTVALVGQSGSGKSTIISLTERFYDPTTGSILLDGHNLHDVNLAWLRSQISLVSQEPVLFDMSIADNIRYGANFREVTDNEVVEAAKSANIHKFIQSLPQGYSTNVGLKGTQLSGGQKQRVAIARALIRDPKILLLDEATSALDTESEKIVQDALDKAKEGRTTIIIAHRLSTIYKSDCIVVLHNGSVIEQGTHAELLAHEGVYYFMNNMQKQEA